MARSPDVVVLLGGEDLDLPVPVPFTGAGLVVAADAGAHRGDALGLAVDHLVGDLDSVSPARLAEAERATTTVHRYPVAKDATDGELALRLAGELVGAAEGAAQPWLAVVGRSAGRLDLLLADLLLLAGPATDGFDVTAHLGTTTAVVVRPGRPVAVEGRAGAVVSLLPVHGAAEGVSVRGVRWPLDAATLPPATTHGISNELLGGSAEVGIDRGTLLVVTDAAVQVRFPAAEA